MDRVVTPSETVNGLAVTHEMFVVGWCSFIDNADLARKWGVNVPRLRTLQRAMRLPGRVEARNRGFDMVMAQFQAHCRAGAIAPDYAMDTSPPYVAPLVDPIAVPFWTPERDAAVIATKGQYCKIAALAQSLGIPSARVTGRWHLVRGR